MPANAMKLSASAMVVAAVLSWAPAESQAAAGTIIFASGDVMVRSAGAAERRAANGTPIDTGDTVSTNSGRAQLRFSDGGQMSLQPGTVFRVDQYSYAGRADGSEKAVFNLVRGGLRAITGLIGRANKDSYRVDTVIATIGIRGTTWQALLCAGACAVPDGLYVKGGEGTVFVQNGFGVIDLSRGQAAYVANASAPPQQTSTAPRIAAAPAATAVPTTATARNEFAAGEFGLKALTPSAGALTLLAVSSGGAAMATSGGSPSFTAFEDGSPKTIPPTNQGGISAGTGTLAAG